MTDHKNESDRPDRCAPRLFELALYRAGTLRLAPKPESAQSIAKRLADNALKDMEERLRRRMEAK